MEHLRLKNIEYIYQLYEKNIPNDELTYLAVHIHRLLSYDQLSE